MSSVLLPTASQVGETSTGSGRSLAFRAYSDPVIFKNDRVLRTLLKKEPRYIPASSNYFKYVQTEIELPMRKEVADWMLEICEVQASQPEIFCLAMNYLDRFLSLCPIARSQLQLLGAVCLLVAWKVREHEPLSAHALVEYADLNFTVLDIMEWEVLLLSKLDWDMSAVIATDFIEHIIQRVRVLQLGMSVDEVRTHSETLITLCASHYSFSSLSPCLVASAAVLTTIRPALESSTSTTPSTAASSRDSPVYTDLEQILDVVEKLTQIHKEDVRQVMNRIEVLMRASLTPSPTHHQDHRCCTPNFGAIGLQATPVETPDDTPTKVLDVAKDC